MSATAVCYYIYYRVSAAHERAAQQAIAGLFNSVERRTGVAGRLLRRQDEPLLWMEVYEAVRDPTGFETALSQSLDACGFASFLAPGSERRTERFVAVSPS